MDRSQGRMSVVKEMLFASEDAADALLLEFRIGVGGHG